LLALEYLRGGGESTVLNCGYGRGYSVREVLEAVKRVSGVAFDVRLAERRAGDPAKLVADPTAIGDRLKWKAKLDDTIIAHALAWEETLKGRASEAA
jgi:UDP-glucose 4-epimerase